MSMIEIIQSASPESIARAVHEVKNNIPDRAFESTRPDTANDMLLAKNAADYLERRYPGWGWLVAVEDGLMTINSMQLSGRQGYVLHVDKIDNDYKAIGRAGGEILERFHAPRGKTFSFEEVLKLRMNRYGHLIADE